MNTSELNVFFSSISPTENQKREMLSAILNKQGFAPDKTIKRPVKRLFMIAAIIVVGLMTAAAALAAATGWHEKLIEYFKPTGEQQEQLANAVNSPDATVQQNGMIITVKQTIADAHGIYVLYEMTVPEEIELTDYYHFEEFNLKVDYADKYNGGASWHEEILGQSGNKRTALICYSTNWIIENQELELTFKNLQKHSNDYKSRETVISGEWNIKWDFSYEDTSKTYTLNTSVKIEHVNKSDITIPLPVVPISPVTVDRVKIHLNDITISPISVTVYYHSGVIDFPTGFFVDLNMKDGTSIHCGNNEDNKTGIPNISGSMDDKGDGSMYFGLNKIINVEDIESITVGDTTIIIQ